MMPSSPYPSSSFASSSSSLPEAGTTTESDTDLLEMKHNTSTSRWSDDCMACLHSILAYHSRMQRIGSNLFSYWLVFVLYFD
jgi:hypothetical protein